jgi:hypothetical protein
MSKMSHQDIPETPTSKPRMVDCFWVDGRAAPVRKARDFYTATNSICQQCMNCQV